MSRRLVTVFGGSGFIGRHVIQRLVKQGAQIRVATRDTEATGYLKPLGEIGQITPVPTSFSDEEGHPHQVQRQHPACQDAGRVVRAELRWRRDPP